MKGDEAPIAREAAVKRLLEVAVVRQLRDRRAVAGDRVQVHALGVSATAAPATERHEDPVAVTGHVTHEDRVHAPGDDGDPAERAILHSPQLGGHRSAIRGLRDVGTPDGGALGDRARLCHRARHHLAGEDPCGLRRAWAVGARQRDRGLERRIGIAPCGTRRRADARHDHGRVRAPGRCRPHVVGSPVEDASGTKRGAAEQQQRSRREQDDGSSPGGMARRSAVGDPVQCHVQRLRGGGQVGIAEVGAQVALLIRHRRVSSDAWARIRSSARCSRERTVPPGMPRRSATDSSVRSAQ